MTLNEVLYILLIIVELTFLIGASVYIIFLIYSWLKGAPYVATRMKSIKTILENTEITDGQHIVELGSGDGRFLIEVAKQYNITGVGVDINPIPLLIARLRARMQKIHTVSFHLQDIRETDLKKADIIYIFLFPKLVNKIKLQLTKNTKKGALIISHGFQIDYLKKYHTKTVEGDTFKTYFYKMS